VARPRWFAIGHHRRGRYSVFFTLQRVARAHLPAVVPDLFASRSSAPFISALTVVPGAAVAVVSVPRTATLQEPSLPAARRAAYETPGAAAVSGGPSFCRRGLFWPWPRGWRARGWAGEFLPELDEGDLSGLRGDAATIGLGHGHRRSCARFRRRMLAFPEVLEVMRRAGTSRGLGPTTQERHLMSEDLRPPWHRCRPGGVRWTKDRLVEAIRAWSPRDSGLSTTTSSATIKDNVKKPVQRRSGVGGPEDSSAPTRRDESHPRALSQCPEATRASIWIWASTADPPAFRSCSWCSTAALGRVLA
jgi:Cu/Ag efflux pump CusA